MSVADFPSEVAVIVVVPAAFVVSWIVAPVAGAAMVATEMSLETQVMGRPAISAPVESFVVAESCTASPAVIGPVSAAIATVLTGMGRTTTVVVPLLPSAVAVIVALPSVLAVTSPVAGFTLATAGSLEIQA